MIPVKYNLRNLRVRWVTTLMTSLFTGLLVCASVLVFGLVDGLMHAFTVSADEQKLIVLRKGSDNETSSQIDGETARKLKNLEGIATDPATGLPMWSAETGHDPGEAAPRRHRRRQPDRPRHDAAGRDLAAGLPHRRGARPATGHQRGDHQPQHGRAVSGLRARREAEHQRHRLRDRRPVRGQRQHGGVGGLDRRQQPRARPGSTRRRSIRSSCCRPRAARRATRSSQRIKTDNDEFKDLDVKDEKEYFQSQVAAMNYIRWIGYILAVFLSLGASFGAANTMYSAVASRSRGDRHVAGPGLQPPQHPGVVPVRVGRALPDRRRASAAW